MFTKINSYINSLVEKIISNKKITFNEAERLLRIETEDLLYLFQGANKLRYWFRGKKIDLCAISNVKSGLCKEDCHFCAQSLHYSTGVAVYPLLSSKEILKHAERAVSICADRYCIVISGKKPNKQELRRIAKVVSSIKKEFPSLSCDASLGEIGLEEAKMLKEAGLDRYNHNIETTESFYSKICSTHNFKDRLKTVEIIKKVGLELCCGGIFGLGETPSQRIELAFNLRDLDVDCIPINFLHPIKGTPLYKMKIPPPLELLKTIAVFRFILPKKQIRVCGGRQRDLRSLQSLIFFAGADAIIIGDYLTTKGSLPNQDLQMIKDLGLEYENTVYKRRTPRLRKSFSLKKKTSLK